MKLKTCCLYVRRDWPSWKKTRIWFFHLDNALAHFALELDLQLTLLSFLQITHPPYSLDMAHVNLEGHLSDSEQQAINGCGRNVGELQNSVNLLKRVDFTVCKKWIVAKVKGKIIYTCTLPRWT